MMTSPQPRQLPRHRHRWPAFTLIEVMAALVVFAIVVLGAIGLMTFSLKTMDSTRINAQATQIIMNEMESLRMRLWEDRKAADGVTTTFYGIKSLGTGAAAINHSALIPKEHLLSGGGPGEPCVYEFKPFAVYGAGPAADGYAPQLGIDIALNSSVRLRTDYVCRRTVTLSKSVAAGGVAYDTALVSVSVSWTDSRGPHRRRATTTMSENGLNDFIGTTKPLDL